ncbi:kynurenine formamidase [Podospora aff. communis PSN243]|uniref:Kynurenine formamidase n=1 Tax=Podospora aff. communis PSN243 TaxID=3040156 RepID=A0AAV9H335_9PEZI|nr:kynurenine formamidase [Podospora aff. communis PSN243]
MPLSDDDNTIWASAPWTPTKPLNTTQPPTIPGYQKHIPYLRHSNPLQTLTIYVPSTGQQPPSTPTPPPTPGGIWILYIHGGAWRDPLIDASSFHPAATSLLLRNHTAPGNPLAGLVSINYRLSPHPSHPSSEPAYNARHPDHIYDVLSAISFLQRAGVAKEGRYILAGHSCGATMAFQAVMDSSRWDLRGIKIKKPEVVVGLNGIYDLVGVIRGGGYEKGLRDAYEEFTRGAFGTEEEVWRGVCPTTASGGRGWVGEWEGRKGVVLVQSGEDGLVPRGQLEGMREVLEREGVKVEEKEAGGGHDEMWERGEGRMAEVLWEVVVGME